MRGALANVFDYPLALRIIPAYAGSTHYSIENIDVVPGSSPRMRGALLGLDRAFGSIGIIPAYAGSTTLQPGDILLNEDHPRVCGEHQPWRYW